MKSPAPGRMLPDGTAVAAAATTVQAARAAVAAGAVLIDLTGTGRPVMTEVKDRYPGILICAPADWADLVRDPATARRTGAILVCADPAAAAAAEARGIGREGILVEAAPARAAGLIADGWRVLVDADQAAGGHALADPAAGGLVDADQAAGGHAVADEVAGPHAAASQVAGPHAAAAVAALSAWLGAAAVRSEHVAAVRRAIDMAGAISRTGPIRGGCVRP